MEFSRRSMAWLVWGFATFGGLPALGQDQDKCGAVYQNAVRNISWSEVNYSALNVIFDTYCSANGSLKTTKVDTAAEVVFNNIPYKGKGDFESVTRKAETFCRDYASTRSTAVAIKELKSSVVVEALSNFNVCREIDSRYGVVVAHKHSESAIVFTLDFRNTTTNFALEGVAATGNGACVVNTPPKNAGIFSWGPWKATESSRFEYSSNFSMICTRPYIEDQSGRKFLPMSVAISTPLFPYVVSIVEDTLYSGNLASETAGRIGALREALTKEKTRADEAVAENEKLKKRRIAAFAAVDGQFNPGNRGKHFGCGTSPDTIVRNLCPNAISHVILGHGTESGGQCGYTYYHVACLFPE